MCCLSVGHAGPGLAHRCLAAFAGLRLCHGGSGAAIAAGGFGFGMYRRVLDAARAEAGRRDRMVVVARDAPAMGSSRHPGSVALAAARRRRPAARVIRRLLRSWCWLGIGVPSLA